MTSINSQGHDQQTDRPGSTDRLASQRSGRRPSQPRFILQPVVLDDTATVTTGRPSDTFGMNEETGNQAPSAEERQPDRLNELSGSRRAPRKDVPLDYRIPMPGRHAIIGALLVCGVIAIMLFVTLLLAGRAPVI
ncbi:hypothetical protein [Roseiflexus sp.]